MYGSLLAKPSVDLGGVWPETGYRTVPIDAIDRDNPVRSFEQHYRSLSNDAVPRWSDFDICTVPADVVPHLALGSPVFDPEGAAFPDHFIYTLEGAAVRSLIGRSMIGLKVGHVIKRDTCNTLLEEVQRALETREPVFSRSDLNVPGRSVLRFTRGVFTFCADQGRVERLLLVLHDATAGTSAAGRRSSWALVQGGQAR